MAAARLDDRRALMLGLACATLLAGCGGSAPRPDPTKEARVVAEANAYCDHLHEMPPVSRRSPQQTGVIQRRLASLSKALRNTAAYLPAGKDLNEAHAARHALQVEESKRAQAGLARPPGPDVRFERLQLRIYHDELALGLTCAGEVARAAHQTEHIFATAAR